MASEEPCEDTPVRAGNRNNEINFRGLGHATNGGGD
jgi:hypothetical protein